MESPRVLLLVMSYLIHLESVVSDWVTVEGLGVAVASVFLQT
jgi:hypothetical protein